MISRITSGAMTDAATRQLQANLSQLARLQEQAVSQRAFAAPSDDPSAAIAALNLHDEQRRTAQYARNIDDGIAWVTAADSAISSSTALLGRARDLVVQGANGGTMNAESRDAIAVEIEGLRDELLAQANTAVLGRSVFAGTSDAPAFDAAYAHSGAPGSAVVRRVSDEASVRVDTDGAAVFGEGAGSVFALLDRIAADLRAGAGVSARLEEIDERRTAMLSAQGAVGVRQAQMERAKEATMHDQVSLEARRAAVEDVDSVEVLVRLQAQELVVQSSLAVTARVLQPSLMDFLR
ncbi:flagellar hook-associated protein FlgL [Microbacterium sp.]|jgi:flagellar hook-associated protein 3 FlgL|uniref:flagellar hook-associated protein FlgL n=1 Tax=Microbacterium sp. TaxID=51671 RepID=UPI003C785B27